jgi:hypothetical protein
METTTSFENKTGTQPESSRSLAIIASTMRSGSTLVKALLQEAPDVSQLSEINFQKYSRDVSSLERMWQLSPRRVLLLKRPAWYHEAKSYPRLPQVESLRLIALVRDCYDTVQSLRKMSFGFAAPAASPVTDRWMATRYWVNVTRRLLELSERMPDQVRVVRYEDLVQEPVGITSELFRFIGSARMAGTDSYSKPDSYRWRWGTDDNSPNIRSLTVQAPRPKPQTNQRLVSIIDSNAEIVELRKRLGYVERPH